VRVADDAELHHRFRMTDSVSWFPALSTKDVERTGHGGSEETGICRC
jgi:hypothetical protein